MKSTKWKFPGIILSIILIIFCFTFQPAIADDETEQSQPKEKTEKCKNRIIAAPLAYYSPETRIAYGAAGSYILRFPNCDNNTRPSSISPIFIYTQNKQFKAEVKTEFYLKNNSYRFATMFRSQNYPDKFFGIGNNTLEDDKENYTSRSTDLNFSALKKFGDSFYFGFEYTYTYWRISERESGGLLDSGLYKGSEGGTLSGIGFIASRDTRNSIYFPTQGDFFELNARFYPQFLGSDFEFSTITLNLRKYFPVFSSHVVAVQTILKAQSGTVPFTSLAQIGGQYLMRGYFQGQYRDKNLFAIQAEYRLPFLWRFGLVGFGGIGSVAPRIDKFNIDDFKLSYGLGLRLLFDKREKIQVRFDYGFGKGSSGFYASIYEAF